MASTRERRPGIAAGNDVSVEFIGLRPPVSAVGREAFRRLSRSAVRLLDVCFYLLGIDSVRTPIDPDGG